MKLLILFLVVSVLFCSFFVVTVINPIHSALFLILTFVQSSILLIFLGADFIGLSIIIIYVGAISILFLFVIMLINIQFLNHKDNSLNFLSFFTFLVVTISFYVLTAFNFFIVNLESLSTFFFQDWSELINFSLVAKLALNIYSSQFLSLSLVAFILLLALIVAIFLSNLESQAKKQDLFNQIHF